MPPIDIEKAIRVFVNLCMIDIIHECNANNPNFKIVIAGGRAVEYYLSPSLQNKLSSEELYSKSFDYDLVVYPLREDDYRSPNYHPCYYLSEDYRYQNNTFVKVGFPTIYPLEWRPYLKLLSEIKTYFKHPLSYWNFSSTLEFFDTENVIDFPSLEREMSDPDTHKGLLVPKFVMLGNIKSLWKINIHIPCRDGTRQIVDFIDLKQALRHVEMTADRRILYFNNNGTANQARGLYVKTTGGTTQVIIPRRNFWNINGRSQFRDVSICAHPGDIIRPGAEPMFDKDVYILRPTILFTDNGDLIGNIDNVKEFLPGYEVIRNNLARQLGIPDAYLATIDSFFNSFVLDEDVKKELRKKKPEQQLEKYKKRLVRIICLGWMNINDRINRTPATAHLFHPGWTPSTALMLYNMKIMASSGSTFIFSRDELAYTFSGRKYPLAYAAFTRGLVKVYVAYLGVEGPDGRHDVPLSLSGGTYLNEDGTAILNIKQSRSIASIDEVLMKNLGRVTHGKIVEGKSYTDTNGNVSLYKEVVWKWSHGPENNASIVGIYSSVNVTKFIDAELRKILRLLVKNNPVVMAKQFYDTICLKANSLRDSPKGPGGPAELNRRSSLTYARAFLHFSYTYDPHTFREGTFKCYRWGTPRTA